MLVDELDQLVVPEVEVCVTVVACVVIMRLVYVKLTCEVVVEVAIIIVLVGWMFV